MVPMLLATLEPTAEDLTSYIPVAIALILGGVIGIAIVGLVTKVGGRQLSPTKAMPFEAGSVPFGSARRRMHVKYYVVALLFIVFDLETVFLFVWAPIYRSLGLYGLAVMSFFIALLIVGLVYEWKKGTLEWGGLED